MGKPYRCLSGFPIYKWTKRYSLSSKMDRKLYDLLRFAGHHWTYSVYDEHYAHTEHSAFAPLPRHAARLYLQNQKEVGNGYYYKVAMMGETYLYAYCPAESINDFMKTKLLPKKGNERYCEILINKYGNRNK